METSRRAAQSGRLVQEHSPEAIRRRLAATPGHSHLGDAVLGAIDGCVTTFAVVAGASGGGFSHAVIVVLGAANLVADGLSMAVGNYQAARTRRQGIETARQIEQRHVDEVPDGEREEVRQIFAAKGFAGQTLDRVVDVITADRALWIDTMLKEELGLHPLTPPPARAALWTFCAFVACGSIPLLPFLLPQLLIGDALAASAIATAITFFAIGSARGRLLGHSAVRSGLSTLATGGAAAAVAYLVAAGLRRAFGASL